MVFAVHAIMVTKPKSSSRGEWTGRLVEVALNPFPNLSHISGLTKSSGGGGVAKGL